MKQIIAMCLVAAITIAATAQTKKENAMSPIYNFTMKTIGGNEKSLSSYKNKVVIIVNVASFCGYTPQYKELESLYTMYKEKGFVILGFPANNFGQQEPGSDSDIKNFCESKYNVSFDLFSKISVKGNDQHPLYKYLTTETDFKGDIGWNFTKFLVDKNGNVVAKYPSATKPLAKEVTQKVEELLARK